MDRRSELALTVLLAGSCLLSAGWQVAARMRPAFVPIVLEQPGLRVAITGAVHHPGVFELAWGSLVADLVDAAGGYTHAAATSLVHAARPLAQGDSVFVPDQQAGDGTGRVSLNSADSWTLQRLPGVGPALAERIIKGRPYQSVDELLDVSGIGPATFARIEPLVIP